MRELFSLAPKWLRLALLFPLLFLNGFLLSLLLQYLRPLIDYVIIASIFAFLLELLVAWLCDKGMKRGAAIATVLLLTLFTLAILLLFLFPIMAAQLTQLISQAPDWVINTGEEIKKLENLPILRRYSINFAKLFEEGFSRLSKNLEGLGVQVINIVLGTFSGLITAILIFIVTIFLLIGGESFIDGFLHWFPTPWNSKLKTYFHETFKHYFFSKLLLAGISSVARAIIFIPLGVPYSVLIAFSLGVTSLVPFISGLLIIIITIVFGINNPWLGLKFFLAALVIDQLTDNALAPRLMGQAVGLSPIWIFISLFIGSKMAGILGLILAIPVASVIKRIVEDLRKENIPDEVKR
jgi:predicted PurR-regulated permease PerM